MCGGGGGGGGREEKLNLLRLLRVLIIYAPARVVCI